MILSGALLSGIVEACQWQLLEGRDASLGDLLANTAGSAIGALLASRARLLLRPGAWEARRLWLIWSSITIAFAAASGWALTPEPPAYVYWSQWTPARTGYGTFKGRLDSLFLFGQAIPNGTPIDPSDAPQPYSEGRLRIRARVTSGPLNSSRALVARAGNPLGEQFQVAQNGTSLVFRGRVNAALLRLRSPTMEFRSVFSPGSHDLELDLDKRATTVRVDEADAADSPQPLTLGYIWQVFMPFEVWSGTLQRAAACLLFGLLFLPLGYWERSTVWGIVPARSFVAGAAVLFVLPVLFRMSAGGGPEMLGAVAGVTSGALVARRRNATIL